MSEDAQWECGLCQVCGGLMVATERVTRRDQTVLRRGDLPLILLKAMARDGKIERFGDDTEPVHVSVKNETTSVVYDCRECGNRIEVGEAKPSERISFETVKAVREFFEET